MFDQFTASAILEKAANKVFRSVPFVFLFKSGTEAEMSVIGVRTVPLYYIKRNRNTIIIGTGTNR